MVKFSTSKSSTKLLNPDNLYYYLFASLSFEFLRKDAIFNSGSSYNNDLVFWIYLGMIERVYLSGKRLFGI